MNSKEMLHEKFRHLACCRNFRGRNEMTCLRKSVDYYKNHCVTLRIGLSINKIYGYVGPGSSRNREGM